MENLLDLLKKSFSSTYNNMTRPNADQPHWSDGINTKKTDSSYWNYPKMRGEPLDKSKRFYTDDNYYDMPPNYGMPRNKKSRCFRNWSNGFTNCSTFNKCKYTCIFF